MKQTSGIYRKIYQFRQEQLHAAKLLPSLDSWPHALVHFSVARVRFVPDQLHHYALCTLACLASPTAKEDQRQTASASSYPILWCRLGHPTSGRPMAQIM